MQTFRSHRKVNSYQCHFWKYKRKLFNLIFSWAMDIVLLLLLEFFMLPTYIFLWNCWSGKGKKFSAFHLPLLFFVLSFFMSLNWWNKGVMGHLFILLYFPPICLTACLFVCSFIRSFIWWFIRLACLFLYSFFPCFCNSLFHRPWTPNQIKEIWKFVLMWKTKYASAIPKNVGVGVDFRPCSEGDFPTRRP